MQTNYSSICDSQCFPPATCDSTTGRCTCPLSDLVVVEYALNAAQETCQCLNHPFDVYNGNSCVSSDSEKK